MASFKDKTVLLSGASRGIGKAIGLKLAKAGANIIVVAKSVKEHPKLSGTIFSAAREMEEAGGNALPVQCDIRDENQIKSAVEKAIEKFGGIDILVNNASAINLNPVEKIAVKRYDLMHDINVRGTLLMSQACIPYLKEGKNPHILTMSPPLNFKEDWLSPHLPYTLTKYNMTMIAKGLAGELKPYNIGVNSLWPQTTIGTAAVRNLLGGKEMVNKSRKPAIVADAAHAILQKPSTECTAHSFIDETVLRDEGITDFDHYAVNKGSVLQKDLFL